MKKKTFFVVLGVMLLLIPGTLWAGNQSGGSSDTPAILKSLGQAYTSPLDDAAIAAVRGQADPQFVLVKVIGLNTFDGWGQNNVKWTLNPLGYRYGFNGGPGWSNPGETPVDLMDTYFLAHDSNIINDTQLVGLLGTLATTPSIWGNIYFSDQTAYGAPSNVNVFGFSLIGGRIFTRPVPMPYSEYSRREAVYGMQLLILGKTVIGL